MWRVFVAIDDQRRIVGFYSLNSFTLAIADLPSELAKHLPRYDLIPAALIGRLARDQRVRGEGLGDLLLADAVRRVIDASSSLAIFASWSKRQMKGSGLLSQLWIHTISEPPPQTVHACVRSSGSCFPCIISLAVTHATRQFSVCCIAPSDGAYGHASTVSSSTRILGWPRATELLKLHR